MPRDIPVGNGELLVTFDEFYRIRDIYYPRVGMPNHTEGAGLLLKETLERVYFFTLMIFPGRSRDISEIIL